MPIVVFDIETVPDTENGARLLELSELSVAEIAEAMFKKRREETGGHDFLAHYLHKVVAITVLVRSTHQLSLYSLGEIHDSEAVLIERFFHGIDKSTPQLISWNGSGFDLPVLHYRALLHGITASRYWETGNNSHDFRWNNYQNRYHERHLDLMDMLANYQSRASISLQHMATLLGFPGKAIMQGHEVWQHYQAGQVEAIRNYCEIDVLNTYLIYLRFQLLRGQIDTQQLQQEYELLVSTLKQYQQPHFDQFLADWRP